MRILLCLLILASCGKKDNNAPVVQQQMNQVKEPTYLDLVNSHRVKLGLSPLSYSFIIQNISQEHSDYMSQGAGRFGHGGWRSRCARLHSELGGYGCGEIVAWGQKSEQAVFQAWLNSPSHRKTIEDPTFTHTGLGMAQNEKGEMFWTQIFIAD